MPTMPKIDPNRKVVENVLAGETARWITQEVNPMNRKERRREMSSKKNRLRQEAS